MDDMQRETRAARELTPTTSDETREATTTSTARLLANPRRVRRA